MKIDTSNNPQRLSTNDTRETQKSQSPLQKKAPENSTQVQTTSQRAMTHDIDAARVEEVRLALSEGRLELHADRIAEGIINSARELLA